MPQLKWQSVDLLRSHMEPFPIELGAWLLLQSGVDAFCAAYSEHFKAANEEERVTDGFVDTAITLGRRVFSNNNLLQLLLTADEQSAADNPFNNWTKLQLIVNKAKSSANLLWAFHAVPPARTEPTLTTSLFFIGPFDPAEAKILLLGGFLEEKQQRAPKSDPKLGNRSS